MSCLKVLDMYWLIIALWIGFVSGHRDSLHLVNNGYEGLTVAITEEIPQEDCNAIVHGLQIVLTELSSELFAATGGRASLREVTVVLPKSWKQNDQSCVVMSQVTSASQANPKVHVQIGSSHPVFGARPWTQQSQGCGKPGDLIHMGGDMLTSAHNESSKVVSMLLAEWSKFRWGIFEEKGCEGDVLFPITFNDPLTGKLRNNTCSGQGSKSPFCLTKNHMPEAPNKHNYHCGGKSAWEVIMESSDFSDGRNNPSNSTMALVPNINFVKPSAPQIVLIVEDTAVMNLQRRWGFVRKAVRRVVVYDIPDGTQVGVVVFNSVASVVSPVTRIDDDLIVRQRIGSSLPRNPSRVPESQKCYLCAIKEAIKSLDQGPGGSKGATLLMISSGSDTIPQFKLDEMVRLANFHNLQIDMVIYPTMNHVGEKHVKQGLDGLIRSTNGITLSVMDEGVGNDSKLSMMMALMDALMTAVHRSIPANVASSSLMIHSQGYPGGMETFARGKFSLDETLGSEARFAVYYYDLSHVGNKIHLTTPSGGHMSTVNIQEEDGDANVIFVHIPNAERGEWSYELENHADSHQGLHIQVTASQRKDHHISMRTWTSSVIRNGKDTPSIFFAEVNYGSLPVLNANVVVKLQRLGTNATGSSFEPIFFNLLDNGNGDPDITMGDGIYSRYIPSQNLSGNYELSISIDGNNGQAVKPVSNIMKYSRIPSISEDTYCYSNVINYEHVTPLPNFHRSTIHGFLIFESSNIIDVTPPSRIMDLKVVNDLTNKHISLSWTAPGNDYDWGKAHHYEGVISSSWNEAISFTGKHIKDLPNPKHVGKKESVQIPIHDFDKTQFIAMRAVDQDGNSGKISNIVSFVVPSSPLLSNSILELGSASGLSVQSSQMSGDTLVLGGFDFGSIAVIVGSALGFVLVIFVLGIACYLHAIRRQKQGGKKNKDNNLKLATSGSSTTFKPNDSKKPVDNVEKDSESPDPMIKTDKLLQELEQQFSIANESTSDAADQSTQSAFPDVTLTTTTNVNQSYPSTPSSITSDPPPYEPEHSSGTYNVFLASYQANYIPNGVKSCPQGPPSQISQASITYTYESDLSSGTSYPQGPSSQSSQSSLLSNTHQLSSLPPHHSYYPDGESYTNPAFVRGVQASFGASHYTVLASSRSSCKIPPPVAPKPTKVAQYAALSSAAQGKPKRRTVSHV